MLNILGNTRRNGRKLLYLILEPQEIQHIKQGLPSIVNTSQIPEYDIVVAYVPDALRFKNLLAQEMPAINSPQFHQLLTVMQQYPEVYREIYKPTESINQQDLRKKQ